MYNIICDSIGLEPKPNNGTLRLPLKPVGLHSDHPSPADDTPTDFAPDKLPPIAPEPSDNSETAKGNDPEEEKLTIIDEESPDKQKETKIAMNKFWEYVKAKMAAAQEWASKVLGGLKGDHKDAEIQSDSFDQGDTPP